MFLQVREIVNKKTIRQIGDRRTVHIIRIYFLSIKLSHHLLMRKDLVVKYYSDDILNP